MGMQRMPAPSRIDFVTSFLSGGKWEWTDSAQRHPPTCDAWLSIALPARHCHDNANELNAQARDKVHFKVN
jgi:hypothetical protein